MTEDAPIQATAYGNLQNWPASVGAQWGDPPRRTEFPTIAIVDSGVESRGDFGRRLIRQVDLTTTGANSSGDGFGHGTLVAGLAVGDADRFTGVEPRANIVSLDVLDDAGNGTVSNLLAACDWILQNKGRYNIDVANFSLNASSGVGVQNDPLDKAVEKLWLNGVVVVAAAGNYAIDGAESGVGFAPGERPVRDHGRCLRHQRNSDTDGRLRGAVVGMGIDAGRLPQAGVGGTRAHAQRAGADGLDDVHQQPLAQGRRRVHVDVGDILRRPDRVGCSRDGALAASGLDAGSGQGRTDGVGERSHRIRLDGRAGRRDVEHRRRNRGRRARQPECRAQPLRHHRPGDRAEDVRFDRLGSRSAADPDWNAASWSSASWSSASWSSASWSSASWSSASWSSASWSSASWSSASWSSMFAAK